LSKTSKNFSAEKIKPVMPIFSTHAGKRKNPDYYQLSNQVLLHPKLGS